MEIKSYEIAKVGDVFITDDRSEWRDSLVSHKSWADVGEYLFDIRRPQETFVGYKEGRGPADLKDAMVALNEGRKIDAIKLLNASFGLSLLVAKQLAESIRDHHKPEA